MSSLLKLFELFALQVSVFDLLNFRWFRELETEDVVPEAQEGDPWVITALKLGGALSRLSNKEKDARYYEVKDKAIRNPVLSLQALGVGPRLRLLMLAMEHLHTQAGTGRTVSLLVTRK